MDDKNLREYAEELYMSSGGTLTPKEIADELGIPSERVRGWKCRGRWDQKLNKPSKIGAPYGNNNRKPGPNDFQPGNTAAVTHGAYSTPRMESLTEEQRREIEETPLEFVALAKNQLRHLLMKQMDLENKIHALNAPDDDETTFLDRRTVMETPSGDEMVYRNESTKKERLMKLETELNHVQGRILKLMDSLRTQEDADRRLELEKQKFQFQKDKALGIYAVDDDGNLEMDVPSEDDDFIVE